MSVHFPECRDIRFCVSYKKLNGIFPLPRVDDCLDSLGGKYLEDVAIFSFTLDDHMMHLRVIVVKKNITVQEDFS